ncbi:MAG TPA: DNA cytosine methyltransferase [Myxococcota bacterium]|nr:DNA cytosine methyltransferase [Myxococcota bacterium]
MIYYNDHDPRAAAWLRELVHQGHLPMGTVDHRSIVDVTVSDNYLQAHFFAGIGGWPLALQLAGAADLRCWTGSCPCQPFSAVGRQRGMEDPRHLWPHWYKLIGIHRTPVVFGEQVASPLGRRWLAHVRADLERLGYAVGAADLCAASVGAPHVRSRLFWGAVLLADTGLPRLPAGEQAHLHRAGRKRGERSLEQRRGPPADLSPCTVDAWHDPDWIGCRDHKWRPVEPGTCPVADGLPGRVGLLRGYGNAIVPQVAAEFVTAFLEAACL